LKKYVEMTASFVQGGWKLKRSSEWDEEKPHLGPGMVSLLANGVWGIVFLCLDAGIQRHGRAFDTTAFGTGYP
jgi:hypothetical protein